MKNKTKRKPLNELYVKGHSAEDREEWQQELQRHCEEVLTAKEETNEIQASETLKKRHKVKWYVRRVFLMDDCDELIEFLLGGTVACQGDAPPCVLRLVYCDLLCSFQSFRFSDLLIVPKNRKVIDTSQAKKNC